MAACVPCAAAAVSTIGAPVVIPGAIVGYIGYKSFSKKKTRKNKRKSNKYSILQ